MNAPVPLQDLTDIPRFLLRGTPENDAFQEKARSKIPTLTHRPLIRSAADIPIKTAADTPVKTAADIPIKTTKPKKLRLTTAQVARLKTLGYGKRKRSRMSREEAEFTIVGRIKNPHADLTAPAKHKKK